MEDGKYFFAKPIIKRRLKHAKKREKA